MLDPRAFVDVISLEFLSAIAAPVALHVLSQSYLYREEVSFAPMSRWGEVKSCN